MLTMTKDDYEKILAHCKEGLPNEACGLIGGTKDGNEKHIKKVYLLTNIDESNEHFSMDPKEQLAAVKDMRANGYQLLGNFHSHPESPSLAIRRGQASGIRFQSKLSDLVFDGSRKSGTQCICH